MNREIKFRAWDGSQMRYATEDMFWVIGDSRYFELQDHGSGNFTTAKSTNGHKDLSILDNCENEKAVLMQFTGLKDKNGKEIYENDVIRHPFGVVKFINGCFCIDELPFSNQYIDLTEIEVIGNIHENPDLLK